MSIDITKLSPWAQKQIAEKVAKQSQERLQKRKYNNTPTTRKTAEGAEIRFDSQKEARRFDELMILLRAGKISDLRLQPQFTLHEAYTTIGGKRVQAIRYQADFRYQHPQIGLVVEDVKSKATKTRVYGIKKKLMLDKFGIEITEIE